MTSLYLLIFYCKITIKLYYGYKKTLLALTRPTCPNNESLCNLQHSLWLQVHRREIRHIPANQPWPLTSWIISHPLYSHVPDYMRIKLTPATFYAIFLSQMSMTIKRTALHCRRCLRVKTFQVVNKAAFTPDPATQRNATQGNARRRKVSLGNGSVVNVA